MRKTVNILLCFATVLLMFMPAVQKTTNMFSYWPLEGETVKTPKPQLTYDDFLIGKYQNNLEKYISENFGFRAPLLRIHNQYLYDFYSKTYSDEVAIGKNNWLYFNFNVNEYYGKEMYRWVSKDDAVEKFTRQMRILNKLRAVLKDYDIEFMIFTSPDKADLYPQYLPDRDFDNTTIHAYDFYREEFAKHDFPYIDMNAWFKVVQDTLDYPAIPQTSAHWVFPSVYAADSLFHFMAKEKGIVMPQIKIGKKIPISEETKHVIRDLEYGLNLWRPIKLDDYEYYDREVSVAADTNAVKMNAIFVGNSFFRAFNQYIPLNEIFNNVNYWFYNMTNFYGPRLQKSMPIGDTDRLYEIINADYIVWFTDNAQMYKISYGFAEDALIKLCVSDSLWNAEVKRYADSLKISNWDATVMLQKNPELIRGLDVDHPTIRNSEGIAKAKCKYGINNDKEWIKALKTQAALQSKPLDAILAEETDNFLNGRPLLRDNTIVSDSLIYDYEVNIIIDELKSSSEKMDMIRQKAKERSISIEEMLILDAQWIVDHRDE